jgi:hypothetical protein
VLAGECRAAGRVARGEDMMYIVTTTDDKLQLYQDRDLCSLILRKIGKGVVVQLGAKSEFEGREWLEAVVERQAGYVLGPSARSFTTLEDASRPAMPKVLTCARCGMLHPRTTLRCACGYYFTSPERMREDYTREIRNTVGTAIGGAVVALGPILFLVINFNVSPHGPWIVFFGLLLTGVGIVVRALQRIKDLRVAKREIQEGRGIT